MITRLKPALPGVALVFNWLLSSNIVQAQLKIGTTALFIKGSTTLAVDGLTLQPSSDLTLADLQIDHNATPIGGIGGNSILRVYLFSKPIPLDGTTGFYYADNELNGNIEATLQVAYQRASDNVWVTTTGSTVDPASNYITQSFTGLPVLRLTATSSNVTLPVILRSYTAIEEAANVKLEWYTSFEQDVDRFEIEHSTDGSHFAFLTKVNGANIATGATYTAYDYHPAEGRNYYRLIQYDRNGSHINCGIRTVVTGAANRMTVTAFPNPATQMMSLRLQDAAGEKLYITLYNSVGMIVHNERIQVQPGRADYLLHIRTMPPKGEYYLQVTGNKGFNQVLKISIQ